jgi:prepilin-type processing-associated H-X9-DG protein
VVVAIITILMALMLPTINAARRQARMTQCLSNLRQIGMAYASYAAIHSRWPPHPYETGSLDTFPNSLSGSTYDLRETLKKLLNADYFACPGVAPWKPSEASNVVVNVDYFIAPGYYADATVTNINDPSTAVFSKQLWIKPGKPWHYGGRTMRVLAGDRVYLDPVTVPGTWRHIVNHPDGARGYGEWSPPGFAGLTWLANKPAGVDERSKLCANFLFVDGSARTYGPNARDLLRIPNRHIQRLGSDYLMPQGP